MLDVFFNHPTKQFSFSELTKILNLSEKTVAKQLKQLQKQHIIKKIKPENSHPHYIANLSPEYRAQKRLRAQQLITPLITELLHQDLKLIILFGSFTRTDWHKDSDIDLFIIGKLENIQYAEREISITQPKNFQEIQTYSKEFMSNVLKGIILHDPDDTATRLLRMQQTRTAPPARTQRPKPHTITYSRS